MLVLQRFAYRAGILLLISWVLALLPSPSEAVPLRLKNGLVGILLILSLGKTLYDSLFYDRFQQ